MHSYLTQNFLAFSLAKATTQLNVSTPDNYQFFTSHKQREKFNAVTFQIFDFSFFCAGGSQFFKTFFTTVSQILQSKEISLTSQ